jgi:hypothetical protein
VTSDRVDLRQAFIDATGFDGATRFQAGTHCPFADTEYLSQLVGVKFAALTRFLDDGRLEIDNNIAERAMRCVALGRKNWLFAGSKAGGERAAAIYTVIETAKLNGLEPQAYIADVIAKIAGDWPASRWDDLMPWNWQAPAEPVRLAA